MKLKNHTLLAVAFGLAMDTHIFGMIGLVAGSTLPDRLDCKLGLGSERLFLRVHRGITHWPWLYVLPFLVVVFWSGLAATIQGQFALWFLIGAYMHIACDMLTPGGIPFGLFSLKKKLSMKWFKTGSLKEYLVTWGLVLMMIGIAYVQYVNNGTLMILKAPAHVRQLIQAFI
ncbi:MAG: metal-dependent hydrolase [Proteobacteria bacterium]|nr:metal-dependent hydrolase [Pseudomonadota bacterium]